MVPNKTRYFLALAFVSALSLVYALLEAYIAWNAGSLIGP